MLLDVVLHRSPRRIYRDTGAENEDPQEAIAIDVEDHVLQQHRLARARGAQDDGAYWQFAANLVFGLLDVVFLNVNRFYLGCFAVAHLLLNAKKIYSDA